MVTVGSEVDEVEMREEAGPLKRLAEEGEGPEERAKRGRGGMRERWGLIGSLSDSDTGGSSPVFPQTSPNQQPFAGDLSSSPGSTVGEEKDG